MIDYVTFRSISDGMMWLMVIYSIFKYKQQPELYYVYYILVLVLFLIFFKLSDENHIYKGTFVGSWLHILTNFIGIVHAMYGREILKIHILKNKTFEQTYSLFIAFAVIPPFLKIFSKFLGLETIVQIVSFIQIYGSSILFLIVIYRVYLVKTDYARYFVIGAVILYIGNVTKLILVLYFKSFFTYDYNNAFSFPNTFTQVVLIIESVFVFLGFAAKNQLVEIEKKELQEKILEGFKEKNDDQTKLITLQNNLVEEIKDTVEIKLQLATQKTQLAIQFLENDSPNVTHTIDDINRNLTKLIETFRNIVRGLVSIYTEAELKQTFIHSIYLLTAQLFNARKIDFEFYARENEYNVIIPHQQQEFLKFYEKIIQLWSKHKTGSKLYINISLSQTYQLFFIIQDEPGELIRKQALQNKLIWLASQAQNIKGNFQYYIESDNSMLMRLEVPVQLSSQL